MALNRNLKTLTFGLFEALTKVKPKPNWGPFQLRCKPLNRWNEHIYIGTTRLLHYHIDIRIYYFTVTFSQLSSKIQS